MTVTRTKHIKRIRTALFIDCSSHRGSPITRRSLGTASFWTENHINKQDRMGQKKANSNEDRHTKNWSESKQKSGVNHWLLEVPGLTQCLEEAGNSLFLNGTSRKQARSNDRKNQKIIQTKSHTEKNLVIKRIGTEIIIDWSSHKAASNNGSSLRTTFSKKEHQIVKEHQMDWEKRKLIRAKTATQNKNLPNKRFRTESIINWSKRQGSPTTGRNPKTASSWREHHEWMQNKRAQKQALSNKDRNRQNMWNRIKAPGITHYWEEPRKSLFPNGTSRKQTKPNGRRNQKHIQIMTVTQTKQFKRIRTALIIDCSSHRGSPISGRSLGTASFWTEHQINKQDRMGRKKANSNEDRHTKNWSESKQKKRS